MEKIEFYKMSGSGLTPTAVLRRCAEMVHGVLRGLHI